MEDYVKRMLDEAEQLEDKVTKLSKFFSTTIYGGLPENKKNLMKQQESHMRNYLNVLKERIELEKK